jgi:hypothetical protein
MSASERRADPNRLRAVIGSVALPAVLAGVALGAGTAGYLLYLPTLPAHTDATTLTLFIEGFFRSLGFLVLSMGNVTSPNPLPLVLLTVGRVAGLLFFSYAAVVGIGVVFAEQLKPLRIEAWAALDRLLGADSDGHVVVCGIGDEGYAIAGEALDNGRNVVTIDRHRTGRIADLEARGAVVLTDDATREGVLTDRARLHRVADVFVTTGSDGTNGDIVELINRWAAADFPARTIDITARIADKRLRQAIHTETTTTENVHLRSYDVASATARELLTAHPVDDIQHPDQRIHVWLVGWTSFSQAVLDQLLNLMHYPEDIDRKVTIAASDPEQVQQDIAALSPGVNPEWWDKSSMRAFVRGLIPDIEVCSLPTSDIELLSNRNSLYDDLQPQDRLTIIADDAAGESLRGLLSTWAPKLNDLTRTLELDAQLAYRSTPDQDWTPSTSAIETVAYAPFGDGCSIASVRGQERDQVARRLALVYHIVYEDDPLTAFPWRDSVPVETNPEVDDVLEWLASLSAPECERHATAVWRDLAEYKRESNRYAADHAAVKRRMATVLGDPAGDKATTVRALAESEHRRWCAEKILTGWEPLPDEATERWEENGEETLRDQRYHPDILPVETLRETMDGEWDKDIDQVKSILTYPAFFEVKSSHDM